MSLPRIPRQEARPSRSRHRTRTTGVGRVVADGPSAEAAVAVGDIGAGDDDDDVVAVVVVAVDDEVEVAVVVGAVRGIVEVV